MVVYFIFLAFSLAWLGLLLLGPYICTLGSNYSLLKELYYLAFSLICHQKPERSYFIWDYQMPVCVRCFGIYLGIIIGTTIYPFFKGFNDVQIPKFKYLWLFLTPIVVDGIAQTFNLYHSQHYVRLTTGIWASGGLVFYFIPLINQVWSKFRSSLD